MITNTKIINYISNRDWIFVSESEKFYYYAAPEFLGFEEQYLLPIPKKSSTVDYNNFLIKTISILSEIYDISVDEIEVIIEEDNAVFSIRIYDDLTNDGKIGFNRFEELIDGIKDLLIDAATFAITPNILTKNKPAEAFRYLNYCKFLQTEVGSFIARIELPSDKIIKEQELFQDEIRAYDINSKLISILSYVKRSVFDSDQEFNETYLEENQHRINLNILKDIEKIYEKTESRNIEFNFSNIYESVKISTENIYNEKLIKLSNLIQNIDESLNEENHVTITGRITNLKSNDPESNSNEISFNSLLDEKPIKVKAKLSRIQYQQAVDAHKGKKNIQITGIIRKMKTQYKFLDIYNFTIQ
ncbi:hypothetical protein [Chryseobacterium sp. sg2396]|uniref:hypothetical protein n=1 Tax=Chryseobacterium sp. sg2396 TaxID=3276280 RepID=UPI0025EB6022|nr:hypothetical protein [uncultured Chryseobacterium sp.]